MKKTTKKDEGVYAGMWDFSGACAPAENGKDAAWANQQTFTLGCFQWESRSGGKGFKKGRVSYRIKGTVDNPAEAYKKARDYCARKNAKASGQA